VITDDTTLCDQAWNRSWSAAGMPSSSQMTVIGSGNANASISSASSRASKAVSSPAVIASMRGRSAATRRGVNTLTTSRRSRV
jgi:hypothetical protein